MSTLAGSELHHLIYVSVAEADLKLGEITAFLSKAEIRNSEDGISGALLFANGMFLQILEGDRQAISSTFCRIQRDNRHCEVCLIDFRATSERRFDGWAMRHLGFHKGCVEESFDPRNWTAIECANFFDRCRSSIAAETANQRVIPMFANEGHPSQCTQDEFCS